MDPINGEAVGFQQTQNTRVKDPGPAQNANPPPPPSSRDTRDQAPVTADTPPPPSPHPNRGQTLNTVA